MSDWKKVLSLQATEHDAYHVLYAPNGKLIGTILKDVDGYYVWWSEEDNYGCWDSSILRAIADALDELNHEWDTIVNDDLGEQPPLIPWLNN